MVCTVGRHHGESERERERERQTWIHTNVLTCERSSILLVRQYSLYNPVPWTNGGVLSLLRVLAQLKTKVSLLGVSATI